MLLAGEGDVITGIVATASRRQKVAFTSEVVPVRHVAVTRRPGPFLSRAEDLRALRVGVIPGTTWDEEATRVPGSRRVAYRDLEALVEGLRRGESDAAVMTLLDFTLAQNRDAELVAGPFVGPFSSAALAVRHDDKPLLGALNGYLEGMREARHALMFKYLSEEALSLIALARRDY
jgi:ABC-type amino acid transport substrate-binding protein